MRIAVLGLGHMGVPIAERVEQAGHDLSVWNRSSAPTEAFAQRGIRVLERPADAWAHADAAITVLADGAAVEAVVAGEHGLLSGAGDGTLIDMSTIAPGTSARVASACERADVGFLRAPVSGNPSVVVAGNLGIIVSGPRAEYDRLSALLADIGPNLFYVGASEQARIVKLALNLMIGGTAQLMAEALVLAERHGIERADLLEVMGASAIGSPFVKYKTGALIADDYRSTFTAGLMHKDLGLILGAADEVRVPLPLTALTGQLVQSCIASGMADWDFTALLPRLRRDAGLEEPPPASGV